MVSIDAKDVQGEDLSLTDTQRDRVPTTPYLGAAPCRTARSISRQIRTVLDSGVMPITVVSVLLPEAVRDRLFGDRMAKHDVMEIEALLEQGLFRIGFLDKEAGVAEVLSCFSYALEKGEDPEKRKGFSPITVPISRYLQVLAAPEARDVSKRVIAVSVGGSHSKSAIGDVSVGAGVRVAELDFKRLKKPGEEGPVQCADVFDFWRKVLPDGFSKWVKQEMDKSGRAPRIAVTLGYPIEMLEGQLNGYIKDFSDKVVCSDVAPKNATLARDPNRQYPTVAASLCAFLRRQEGISIAPEDISVSPNDTVSTTFAFAPRFNEYYKPDCGETVGSFIDGTGCNAFLVRGDDGVNTEMGHSTVFAPSDFDAIVALRAGKEVADCESLVSGAIMGDVFKFTVESFLGAEHSIAQTLRQFDNNEAVKLIFELSYGTQAPAGVPQNGVRFLRMLARKFTERAVKYISIMLAGIELVSRERLNLFAEGSLVTKNLSFAGDINHAYRQLVQGKDDILVNAPLPAVSGLEKGMEMDCSLAGTFYVGLADEMDRERRS